MLDTEVIKVINRIIEYTQTGEHTEFHFLRSWPEYKYYKNKRKAFKQVIRMFKNISRRYRKRLGENTPTYERLQQILNFYKKELDVVTEIIYEYEAYLLTGNYLSAMLGELRDETDLVDFRGRGL